MENNNKPVRKSFDEMFGDAQEFVPNPTDIVESDFASLDEEEGEGEEELIEIDCTGLEPADEDAVGSDEDDDVELDDADLEELDSVEENDAKETVDGLSDEKSLVDTE